MANFRHAYLMVAAPLLAVLPSAASAMCVAPPTIAGVWKGNDGGTYDVRLVGNTVWWVGTSGDGGRSWKHAFHGSRNGNTITGNWADVAGGVRGAGTLTLQVTGTSYMRLLSNSGSGFGGSRWNRGPCNDMVGKPVDE